MGPQATWARLPHLARLPPLGAPMCLEAYSFSFWPPPEASRVSYFQKKLSNNFVAFGLRLVLISWKIKNRQKIAPGTSH